MSRAMHYKKTWPNKKIQKKKSKDANKKREIRQSNEFIMHAPAGHRRSPWVRRECRAPADPASIGTRRSAWTPNDMKHTNNVSK